MISPITTHTKSTGSWALGKVGEGRKPGSRRRVLTLRIGLALNSNRQYSDLNWRETHFLEKCSKKMGHGSKNKQWMILRVAGRNKHSSRNRKKGEKRLGGRKGRLAKGVRPLAK